MNIAILCPYANPEKGAAVVRTNYFKEYFENNGHSVEIFAPCRKGVKPTRGVNRYKRLPDIANKLKKVDLIMGVSPPITHNFLILTYCKLINKPFILDAKDDGIIYSTPPQQLIKGLKRKGYLLMRKITYENANALFFLTEQDKKEATNAYNLKNKKMEIIQNGTDPNKMFFTPKDRQKIRKKLNIPKKARVLIYAGGIGDEEIHEAQLNKKKNDYLLLVLAVEPSQLKLIKTLKEPKTKIIINVPYKQMHSFLSASDIGLVPWPNNLPTSLPTKIFDYLACGLPVITKASKNSTLAKFYEKYPITGKFITEWTQLEKASSQVNHSKRNERIKLAKNNFSRETQAKKALEIIEQIVMPTGFSKQVARQIAEYGASDWL